MATKTKYDRALLDQIITRDGATLVGTYEKLNRDIRINYNCKCGNTTDRTFRDIHKKGAFCHICIFNKA